VPVGPDHEQTVLTFVLVLHEPDRIGPRISMSDLSIP
jgi:hypothetical protein